MRKAAFHNLGCKVNSYETEAMQELLEDAGYEIVPFTEVADVYVVNTCSVTNIADRKSRQMLHRARKRNPRAVVVAAGCYVQAAGEELINDKAVDLIVGNNRKAELAKILDDYFGRGKGASFLADISDTHEYERLGISRVSEHARAFIKIQDGCNQFCSYCIIPYTRGRVRSRKPEEILDEVKSLVGCGYREVVLTGIHLSSYGVDFQGGERADLLGLIASLNEVNGLSRIRLGSLEPRIITEEFAGTLAGLTKVCPHFHLSLQSGCDGTLRRMNRRYTTAEYMEKCGILRAKFENPAITTDVIVGFPGETDEEFEETEVFLEAAHFYEMHVFKYSRRAGTRADGMADQVDERVKADRSDRLISLGRRMSREYREGLLGRERTVLTEEKTVIGGREYMAGHTAEYVKAAVPCGPAKPGAMITGRLTQFLDGEVLLLSCE